MQDNRVISGNTEEEIWQQISADLFKDLDLLQYHVLIKHHGKPIYLDIDIDLGGGFEGGYATTILVAPFHNPDGFRFAIHREDFIDEIGKFFGMQDVEIGDPEFDGKVLVKTNNEAKVKALFTDPETRQVFQQLLDYNLSIEEINEDNVPENARLKLFIEEGLTVPETLRQVYKAFYQVLILLEKGTPHPGSNPASS